PLPPGGAAGHQTMAAVDRSLCGRWRLLDAAGALVQDLGWAAGDLRRGQEPDDRAHEARAASGCLVAAAALGNEPRRLQRSGGEGAAQWRFAGPLALPRDGAAAR